MFSLPDSKAPGSKITFTSVNVIDYKTNEISIQSDLVSLITNYKITNGPINECTCFNALLEVNIFYFN